MLEEGTVDLVSFAVTNEMAHSQTTDILENREHVQNFLHMQINGDPSNLNSPHLCKKYDYYFAKKYSQN